MQTIIENSFTSGFQVQVDKATALSLAAKLPPNASVRGGIVRVGPFESVQWGHASISIKLEDGIFTLSSDRVLTNLPPCAKIRKSWTHMGNVQFDDWKSIEEF